jgi:hypothetical protein
MVTFTLKYHHNHHHYPYNIPLLATSTPLFPVGTLFSSPPRTPPLITTIPPQMIIPTMMTIYITNSYHCFDNDNNDDYYDKIIMMLIMIHNMPSVIYITDVDISLIESPRTNPPIPRIITIIMTYLMKMMMLTASLSKTSSLVYRRAPQTPQAK